MRLSPALFVLVSLATAVAQTPTTPAPTAPTPSGAAPAGMATYRSDVLRLSYSYPSNYVDATPVVAPAFEASIGQDASMAASLKCISLPLSRMSGGPDHAGILLLVREDAACMKRKFESKDLTELAQDEAKTLAASGAKGSFGKPVSYDVATHPAALLQGSFLLPTGQPMQTMVVCVLDQPDVACWQFLSGSAAGLATLSAFPVTFDGGPATPLVPAGLVSKP